MGRKYSLGLLITLMLIASALTCMVTAITVTGMFVNLNNNNVVVQDYAALLDIIDRLYIGEYNEYMITTIAMNTVVDALGDRWSYYLSPEEYAGFINDSNNQFPGIGVGVVPDEATGGMIVESVYTYSSAEMAGIVVGDVIIGIDGEDISGETIDDMRNRLSRPIGDAVDLTLLRQDGSIVILPVIYEYVFMDPITFELLDDNIGYIKIENFDYGTSESFISALEELIEDGADKLIIDVRYNGGGRVVEMTAMLDYLLPEGEIFVAVDRYGTETITESDQEMVDIPCVVLVDRFSFSAAEYFAATLREYDYAMVVGEQTTGKSRIQTTYNLPGGGALHISTSRYVTKNRVDLDDAGGVKPDYQVILTDEEYGLLVSNELEKEADPQLLFAIDLLY